MIFFVAILSWVSKKVDTVGYFNNHLNIQLISVPLSLSLPPSLYLVNGPLGSLDYFSKRCSFATNLLEWK